MTIDEYFGDWMKVLDRKETVKIMNWLKTTDSFIICKEGDNLVSGVSDELPNRTP